MSEPLKMLLIGDSGSGKSGSLLSLAEAGYTLHICDFDSGTILQLLLRAKEKKGEDTSAVRRRIFRRSFSDNIRFVGDKPMFSGAPTAIPQFLKALEVWKATPLVQGADEVSFGPVAKLDDSHILVLDSMTNMARRFMHYFLFSNQRMGEVPTWRDYNAPQQRCLDVIERLYSEHMTCNLIAISHITYTNEDPDERRKANDPGTGKDAADNRLSAEIKGYPSLVGKAASPMVGRYFNTMLRLKSTDHGGRSKRVLITQPGEGIDLKCPMTWIPRELPFDTGLATIFKEWKETFA